jgi:hypothetical protein
MNLDRFTTLLADRLSAIVPAGFHVSAEDGMLWYSADQAKFSGQRGDYGASRAGTYMRSNFGRYGESDAENIVGIGVQSLSELQDYISEAAHIPWPGVTSQPVPHGQIFNSYLQLWYGDLDNPAAACEPILLTDVE